jgi:hypothetical protein
MRHAFLDTTLITLAGRPKTIHGLDGAGMVRDQMVSPQEGVELQGIHGDLPLIRKGDGM